MAHHTSELEGYDQALAAHPHNNEYFGRAEADLTVWVEYLIGLTARIFEMAKEEALRCARKGIPAEPDENPRLDRRARMVIALFGKN